jgi:hypothetical protein
MRPPPNGRLQSKQTMRPPSLRAHPFDTPSPIVTQIRLVFALTSPPSRLFSFASGSGDTSESVGENRGTSMRCSKCGFDNPAGMRFCGKCRTALALTCPNCSFENPPGFDFCGQCAAGLNGDGGIAKAAAAASKPAATAAGELRARVPARMGQQEPLRAYRIETAGPRYLQLVHRRLRHGGFEGRQGAPRRVGYLGEAE